MSVSLTPKVEYFEQAVRLDPNFALAFSGMAHALITITGAANFGSPIGADTIFPTWTITQFQDNLTRTFGTHVVKFGGGLNFYNQSERSAVFSLYTFASIADYILARNGTPRNYTTYEETFGDPAN